MHVSTEYTMYLYVYWTVIPSLIKIKSLTNMYNDTKRIKDCCDSELCTLNFKVVVGIKWLKVTQNCAVDELILILHKWSTIQYVSNEVIKTYQVLNDSWSLDSQQFYCLQYINHLFHFKTIQYGEQDTKGSGTAKQIAKSDNK